MHDRATIDYQRAIPIKFHDYSWFFHQSLKKLAVIERLLWLLGTRFSGRSVVERFKEESMYWLSGGQNKVAVVETEVAVSGASTKFDHPASISFIISITSKLSCPSCSLVSLDFNHIVEGVTDREAVNSRQFRKCGRDYFSSFRIERRKRPTKFKSTAWRLERNKPSSISLSWGEDRKRF